MAYSNREMLDARVLWIFLCLSCLAFLSQGLNLQILIRPERNGPMAALILAQSESFRDTQPLASIRSVSEAVIAHSGQIDALAINGRSNNDAAASACKLCLLIFGPIKVVEKSNPSYFTGVNENWSEFFLAEL